MKRVVFILLLVYASSILNVPELCAQKVQAGWVHVTTEKEKIEKEKKEKEKKEKEKKEKEKKEDNRDYIHSVGIAVGSSYGLAYKYFFMDNWALKTDATTNIWRCYGEEGFCNFDFNPNIVYQKPIKTLKTCKLDFFIGGGTTYGYCYNEAVDWQVYDYFMYGINAILGWEFNWKFITMEFDFRPGCGMLFNNYFYPFFDWSVNATISYKF